jgi:hypothetical protein
MTNQDIANILKGYSENRTKYNSYNLNRKESNEYLMSLVDEIEDSEDY